VATDRHLLLSGVALEHQRAFLDDLHGRAQVAWGDRLTWRQFARLALLPTGLLRLARQGRALNAESRSTLRQTVAELEALALALPEDFSIHDGAELYRLLGERLASEPEGLSPYMHAATFGKRLK